MTSDPWAALDQNSSGARAYARPVSGFERERVDFLEPGRVPFGAVTVLAGDPGLGKSLKTISQAARLSRGELTGKPEVALIATAEDSIAATVRPRLEAAGADLDLVQIVQLVRDGFPDGLRLPDDVQELDRLVAASGARLVVVDPLVAHLPAEVNSWRDQSVRLALAPLHALAERHGCATEVVVHLNKSVSSDWLRRIGGSIGITGAARSTLLMARDPDDPEGEKGSRRVLAHVKCNVGPEMPSLLYEMDPILLPAGNGNPEVETVRLVELGESEHEAEALLSGRGDPEERNALEEAVAFLEEELGGGRVMDAKKVQRSAKDAGHASRTLDRAKQRAGVVAERVGGVGKAGHWTWRLSTPRVSAPLEKAEGGILSARTHGQTDSADPEPLRPPISDIGALGEEIDPGRASLDELREHYAEEPEAEQAAKNDRFCDGCQWRRSCEKEGCWRIECEAYEVSPYGTWPPSKRGAWREARQAS